MELHKGDLQLISQEGDSLIFMTGVIMSGHFPKQTPKYVDQIFQRPQICWLDFQKQNCLRSKNLIRPKIT